MARRRAPTIPDPTPPIDIGEAARLLAQGLSYATIGARLGYRASSIRRCLLEHGIRPRTKRVRRNEKWGEDLYAVWKSMRRRAAGRCDDVAASWNSFDAFYDWALAAGYRPGQRLRRENAKRPFGPRNCRWQRMASAPEPRGPHDGVDRRRLYRVWYHMRRRCEDPHDPAYGYYGAKGARVCRAWSEFEPFHVWARGAGWKPGLCLTRRGRARVFSPASCHWVTRAEAARAADHPDVRMPPRWTVTAFGETKGPTQWSRDRRCSVTLTSLLKRLRDGWAPEAAIATPPQRDAARPPRRLVTAFGQTQGAAQWARDPRCKVTLVSLLSRLDRGISPEEAITTRPFGER